MQQPGVAAVRQRLLGNQLFRQIEIKVRYEHLDIISPLLSTVFYLILTSILG
jgi:hypothetical protein